MAAFCRKALGLKVFVVTPEDHDQEAATVQGLTHLIAISGFHVGLVAGAATLLLRGLWWLWPPLGRRPRLFSRLFSLSGRVPRWLGSFRRGARPPPSGEDSRRWTWSSSPGSGEGAGSSPRDWREKSLRKCGQMSAWRTVELPHSVC